MSNSRKIKDQKVHALLGGSERRALCSKKKVKNATSEADEVTCLACGKAALRAVQDAMAAQAQAAAVEGSSRQESVLASGMPPRWWEASQTEKQL